MKLTPSRLIFVIAMSMIVLSTSTAASQEDPKFDVTGTWALQVETRTGSGMPTVTFKQDGEKLTGHYSSANLGEADLTGIVMGRGISFSFVAEVQGMRIDVAYSGIIETKDAMKGHVNILGVGEGTFTGKRK